MGIDYRKMLIAVLNKCMEHEGLPLGQGPSDDLEGLSEGEAVELAKLRDLVIDDAGYCYYDLDGNPISPDDRERVRRVRQAAFDRTRLTRERERLESDLYEAIAANSEDGEIRCRHAMKRIDRELAELPQA